MDALQTYLSALLLVSHVKPIRMGLPCTAAGDDARGGGGGKGRNARLCGGGGGGAVGQLCVGWGECGWWWNRCA